ncbi:MAG: hypothetical protein KGI52_15795 [Burkholderiales bacterium]|nr:hypothetical protein [Burkholderiales bacterium]
MNTHPLSLLNDSAFSVVADLELDANGVIEIPAPRHRLPGDLDRDAAFAEPLRATYHSSTRNERRAYTQAQALVLAALRADDLADLVGAVNLLRGAFSDLVEERTEQHEADQHPRSDDDGPPIFAWELVEARDLGRGA